MPSPFSSSSSSTPTSSPTSISPSPMDRRIEELHFDVPLISTRRASNANKSNQSDPNHAYSTETSRSVPFVWERVPGVPKEHMIRSNYEEEVFTPKPPPGRWRPPSNLNESTNDGDIDDDAASNASETDMFSDALDKMSLLSESLGVPCRLSVSKDTVPGVTRAPSFIMNRFLPAANALAASTAAALPKYSNRRASSGPKDLAKLRLRHSAFADATNIRAGLGHGQHGDGRLASPTKACGIMLLFPWSMGAVCGLKSPIRCQTRKMATLEDYIGGRSRRGGAGDYVLGSDDGLSSKAWKSPGWGLPFLDTSRLRSNVGRESRRRKHRGVGLGPESGTPLPRLKTPREPWLANALNSANRKKH